jgi:hypothetical protein
MSLQYYLFYRKKYESILSYLDENIENYNFYLYTQNTTEDINFFIERKNFITKIKNIYDKRILELCKHDFVKDNIDISHDKCMSIKYCKICEYTEK